MQIFKFWHFCQRCCQQESRAAAEVSDVPAGCRVAVEGRLWGPALLLARHCGDKAFLDTAAAMAKGSTTAGSPLHTLTLLMSGKADAVHAGHAGADARSKLHLADAADSTVVPASPFGLGAAMPTQDVLSQWQGNLAILAGNKVAGNEAAMVQLGERLWRERPQVNACNIVYSCIDFSSAQTARHAAVDSSSKP